MRPSINHHDGFLFCIIYDKFPDHVAKETHPQVADLLEYVELHCMKTAICGAGLVSVGANDLRTSATFGVHINLVLDCNQTFASISHRSPGQHLETYVYKLALRLSSRP